MQIVLLVLAIAGGVALSYRFVRALAGLGLAFAEGTTASGLAEVSARRGDLSSLAERQAAERAARSRQRKDLLLAVFWLVWLLGPVLASLPLPFYAAAAALWVLPYRPIRLPTP